MMRKRKYITPSIETSSFMNLSILIGSDKVGLITGEGGNAAKYYFFDLDEDDDMAE